MSPLVPKFREDIDACRKRLQAAIGGETAPGVAMAAALELFVMIMVVGNYHEFASEVLFDALEAAAKLGDRVESAEGA
jgi:hypothetical protein